MPHPPGPQWFFFFPFYFHYHYLLNTFYHLGALFFDSGLLAQVIWHNDWKLTNPPPRGNFPFLGVHFSPFLSLASQFSYFLAVHRVEFFAGFMAGIYASLGLAMFWALNLCAGPRAPLYRPALAVLAIAFAFNGFIMQAIWDPHFEFAVPLGIFLFLLCHVQERWLLSLFFFIFTLLVREDGGLQLASLLVLIACIRYRQQRHWRAVRMELGLIAVAFAYTLLAWWLTHEILASYHMSGNDVFTSIYTGKPPYAHLSWPLLCDRANCIFRSHSYLWASFLLTMLWAAYRRDGYLAMGFIAYIPWGLLNWTAAFGGAGCLNSYKIFPFVVSMGWPVLSAMYAHGLPLPKALARETLLLQAAMILISITLWTGHGMDIKFYPLFGAGYQYTLQKGAKDPELIEEFIARLPSAGKAFGTIEVDKHVASLTIGPFEGRNLLMPGMSTRPIDTLIYMRSLNGLERDVMRKQIETDRLIFHYCVGDTDLCVFTNRNDHQLGVFSSLLVEMPPRQ